MWKTNKKWTRKNCNKEDYIMGVFFFWKHVKQEKHEQLQDTFFWRYNRILSNFCVEGKLFLDQSVKWNGRFKRYKCTVVKNRVQTMCCSGILKWWDVWPSDDRFSANICRISLLYYLYISNQCFYWFQWSV